MYKFFDFFLFPSCFKSYLKCNRKCGKMLVMSRSAIFLWLLFTFTAADLIKNGNENVNNGTEKANRTSVPGGANGNGSEYKETKRFRQYRPSSEDIVNQSAKNVTIEDTSAKNTETIRSRHSIKTKHKHKRMWHELSNDQKNNTITLDNVDKASDTKELIKSNVNDTANANSLITIGGGGGDNYDHNRTKENNKVELRNNNAKSNDAADNDDNVKQINTVIDDKAKNAASNEDISNSSASSRSKIQRISARVAADNSTSASINFNTPSHRKKRRRILFSSTQPVPIDALPSQTSVYNNFQPIEQSFPKDHIVPFLDFGRKIGGSGTIPRGNVNFVDSLLTELRSRPIEPKPQIVPEDEPIHDDMDVTMDRKTIEKNHVHSDRLHVASTNLANYYRRSSTTKPSTTNTTTTTTTTTITTTSNAVNNSSTCIPAYRIRRPYPSNNNKTLKREINQNITICQYNVTTSTSKTLEDVKPETKKVQKNRLESSTTYKISFKNDTNQVTESPAAIVDVTTSLANQFTTKILSTAVITSVSVKSNDDDLTVPIQPYISVVDQIPKSEREETRKKSKSEKSFDNTYNSSGVVFSALNKNKPVQSTVRPSLTFYQQRNTAKNFRTSTRNAHISKTSQISQSTRPTVNLSTSDNSPETTTKQYQVQPSIINTFNFSDPNIGYLLGSNPTTQSAQPESEPLENAEITTDELFNQKPTVVIVTVNEGDSLPISNEEDLYNSSSTPSIITYKNTERNTENWRYLTNVENESSSKNSTQAPQIYAIFSKSSVLNFTRVESPVPSTTPKLAAKPTIKPSSEEYAVGYQIGFHIITYVLAGLGIIPLVIGIFLITKMILSQNKKQIFEGSEYSSEYNRNPLEFNGGVTSSPIATKLPRVPHHMAHWEIEKKAFSSINLPNNSKWEFPRDKLRLQTILGQGNFGQVWKAEADDISGHEGLTRLVAVKMVKEISSTREKEDLIKELVIMQHLGSHPNVVTLLGCCTEKEPYMLIMEYVMYGKLLSFLRDHRTRSHYFNFSDNGDTLTSRDLTVFAYCVARGMEYLQNKQIIHRDLAARNILVDHNKLCKIADFGMSRHVGESGQVLEHRQSKGALPIRWMAPESLHYSCYTHKTDVWSFGILMWEIVTLGSMPYASMGARVVMRKVKEGYRLEKPKHCKSQLFNVISKCWSSDPNKRPTFTELKQDLGNLLEDPEHDGNYVDLDSLVEEMNQVVHRSHNEKIVI